MDKKLITLAIHTPAKARVLQQTLEERGIETFLENVEDEGEGVSNSIAVRINEYDIIKAVGIIESVQLFRYDNEQTYKIDDGRKRILVAVDFSGYSIKVCRAAFAIASKVNAKVKILHVYKMRFPITFPFADSVNLDNEKESPLDKARRLMLDFCYEIDKKISEKEFPSVNYSYSLREGIESEEIENFTHEYKPFLLVLGTKGKSNNVNDIVGNVTADIIEMTNIPVIAIPENSPIKKMDDVRHIAFLTNFQKGDLDSFDMLVNILRPYQSVRITLIHVNAVNRKGDRWTETELLGMKEYFQKKYPELNVGYELLDSPDMIEAVDYFIDEEGVNIIALTTKRRNLLGRIFLPSVSRKVLHLRTDMPLLILRG
ncbi:universal stress protein [Dysgonomonas sp. 511]|uniref:universal stress protein n=1 Tax=Dysgonomonas sp. 511 TaxID=2302930 RepID=UPI0013D547E2|nr:universal stress protein [Dysgonomonas sp. 511]NDV79529.1 universal stress protein [Dysgonomonas sp. 511]